MIKIRKGMFETNSSSVHAIAVQKSGSEQSIPDRVTLRFDEYGWSQEVYNTLEEKMSYLLEMAIGADSNASWSKKRYKELCESGSDSMMKDYYGRISKILELPAGESWVDKFIDALHGIGFKEVDTSRLHKKEDGSYKDEGYIDHEDCWGDMIKQFCEDPDLLRRFLLGYESYVETGNDNDYDSCPETPSAVNFDIFEKSN